MINGKFDLLSLGLGGWGRDPGGLSSQFGKNTFYNFGSYYNATLDHLLMLGNSTTVDQEREYYNKSYREFSFNLIFLVKIP